MLLDRFSCLYLADNIIFVKQKYQISMIIKGTLKFKFLRVTGVLRSHIFGEYTVTSQCILTIICNLNYGVYFCT